MKPIVIVGTGLAGYTLARELRKIDQETPLILLSRDDGHFYSKPMLSNAFAQGKDAQALINTPAEKMAAQLKAEIRTHTQVETIDTDAHHLALDDGAAIQYGRLVLALGADPIRLPLEGDAVSEVLSVNDRLDYARFREALQGKRRVAILGAGLIGCEFANDLLKAGYEVTLIDLAAWPLGRLLPEQAGREVSGRLAEAGVRWLLGRSVAAVERSSDGYRLTLDDGNAFEVEVVLSAVGLRPRTDLASAAGLAVERGIRVDEHLRTSAPDVYALGDCADVAGRWLPYVMPIMHAARALAKTLAGEPTAVRYPAMPVVVKIPACPTVVSPPSPGMQGNWEIGGEGADLICRFVGTEDQLLGFALTGNAVSQKNTLLGALPAVLD
jgi:rubredoxin-NAD+ reductase